MVAYTYRMPSGIPGTLTRVTSYPNAEAQILSQTNPPTAFGVAVSLVSGAIAAFTAAATNTYGILVRDYPTSGSSTSPQTALGTSSPNASFPASVLVGNGYINVAVQAGPAPVKGGTVYIRNAAATAGLLLGGIESASSGNNFALTSAQGVVCYFTGGMDANGNSEIAYNV